MPGLRPSYLFNLALSLLCLVQVLSATAPASEIVLHSFVNYQLGARPDGALVADAGGNLYGIAQYGGEHDFGSVFRLAPGANGHWARTVIYSFKGAPLDGMRPRGGVIFDNAGNLYGVTSSGGQLNAGTVYRLSPVPSGQWNESILYEFGAYTNDGVGPETGLVFDASGNLYGTTHAGGQLGGGTVFELSPSPNGWSENVLQSFQGLNGPTSGLILDKVGSIYGSAQGEIFQLVHNEQTGWTENILCQCADLYEPGLVLDAEGNLYSTTSQSGPAGEVFELKQSSPNNWTLLILYTFAGGVDGAYPHQNLVLDSLGNLYGVTEQGGTPNTCYGGNGCGTVYQLTPQPGGYWQHTILYTFKSAHDGAQPNGLLRDQLGNLYGTTLIGGDVYCQIEFGVTGCGTVFALTSNPAGEWNHYRLAAFHVGDGREPQGTLVSDVAGNLYGISYAGGTYDGGIAFKLSPAPGHGWKESILHSFGGSDDGAQPSGGLIWDEAGNLFGVTSGGNGKSVNGTVFQLSPNIDGTWKEAVIHRFDYANGAYPTARLLIDSDGNLYGTTRYGGTKCGPEGGGCGVVFELSPRNGNWPETVLYAFGWPPDGSQPETPVVMDNEGNLYGSTYGGGSSLCIGQNYDSVGCGTLYRLSRSENGWIETGLYSFSSKRNSTPADPGALTFDSQGNLYGTSAVYGKRSRGLFFQLNLKPDGGGVLNELYTFGSQRDDGASPNGVVFDASGNAYGTTATGGSAGFGTIFELSPTGDGWAERVLYSFKGREFGGKPSGDLLLGVPLTLFGTTQQGGPDGIDSYNVGLGGTVFQFTP
jgi:uncharacterized repeat protein (TIGR03803 family)